MELQVNAGSVGSTTGRLLHRENMKRTGNMRNCNSEWLSSQPLVSIHTLIGVNSAKTLVDEIEGRYCIFFSVPTNQ
jgi:hypothetical protein